MTFAFLQSYKLPGCKVYILWGGQPAFIRRDDGWWNSLTSAKVPVSFFGCFSHFYTDFTTPFGPSKAKMVPTCIHPSIHPSSTAYPGSGLGGSSLSRKTSLWPATSSSSPRGILGLPGDGLMQSWCRARITADAAPVRLSIYHFPLNCAQIPVVFELLYLWQDVLSDPEKALHLFPAENHGLRFKGADFHPGRFTLVRRSGADGANRTTSSAKSRHLILSSQNRSTSTPRLCLEILFVKVMNRIGDKGQPRRSPTLTGN